MLRQLNDLLDWKLEATDGDIGTVTDFLFDDERWTVRYLVVNPGGWMSVDRVLIIPGALAAPDPARRVLPVTLSREQVRKSPPLESAITVSRAYEALYARYYGYPYYWTGWGMASYPVPKPDPAPPPPDEIDETEAHLRGLLEVKGYHLHATDGPIGHVDDLLADDVAWDIRYLHIDTSNWIGGRSVLISPRWAQRIDWANSRLHLDVPRDVVERSPQLESAEQLTPEDEQRLQAHYQGTAGRARH